MSDAMSPIDGQGGRTPLHRDDQQWILDYLIQRTGKVFHFQGNDRGGLPESVHSHAMIPKHLGKRAQKSEAFAQVEDQAGHRETALDYYWQAAQGYAAAQHPIFEVNAEKRTLYSSLKRCYERVADLAPYHLELVEVPWEGSAVTGWLHLNPASIGPAPLLFFIPGCDVTKEQWPHPHFNQAHQRGMHVFAFDGPGQGRSNIDGVRLTSGNYEAAASAAIDVLAERPEVDADRLVVYSASFGTQWAMRLATLDHRIKALAAVQVSIADKYIQTDLESPRWKQLFAFVTGASNEAELDEIMGGMSLEGQMDLIECPTLMTVGEYDPRAPLPEIYDLFDQMKAPAELWVMADQHHTFSVGGGPGWARGRHGVIVDWLNERLDGQPLRNPGQVLYLDGSVSPSGPDRPAKRRWFD